MKKILIIGDRKSFDAFRQTKLHEHGNLLRFESFGSPIKLILPMIMEYVWYEKLNHIELRGLTFDSVIILSDQQSFFDRFEAILLRVRSSESYFKALKTIHDEQEALRKKQVKRLVNLSKPKKEPKPTKHQRKQK